MAHVRRIIHCRSTVVPVDLLAAFGDKDILVTSQGVVDLQDWLLYFLDWLDPSRHGARRSSRHLEGNGSVKVWWKGGRAIELAQER